jgi:hypothetical protein
MPFLAGEATRLPGPVQRVGGRKAGWTMTRTTFSLEDRLLKKLHMIAQRRGVSLATVIRDSLEKTADELEQPAPTFIGIAASKTGDIAQRSTVERPEPRSWR